ncbi:MAG: hypothetical protein VW600_16995 [Ferrovibrio sp.]
MKPVQGFVAVAVAALLAGCVTANTTIKKSVDAPVPVEGLNVLFVNAPLISASGSSTGTVMVDANQLAGAVSRELPKKFEAGTIPVSVAIAELPRNNKSPINLNTQFPLTATTHHLLVVQPVAAREACRVQPGGYHTDCSTRFTVTTRLVAPGNLSTLWESRVQETQLRLFACSNCSARFDSLANDIADTVMKVVVKRPPELSQGLAGQIKLDESRLLFDLGQKPDDVTPIIGVQRKK